MKISLQVCRVCPTRVDRSPISRATVLRPRRRRSVLRLVDGVGDLDSEPSSGPILIVIATVSRRRENDLTAVDLADLDLLDADAELVVAPLGLVGVCLRPDPHDVRPRR